MQETTEQYLKRGGQITYIENTQENIWHLAIKGEMIIHEREPNPGYKQQKPYGKMDLLKMRSKKKKRQIEEFFEQNPDATAAEAIEELGISQTLIYRHRPK